MAAETPDVQALARRVARLEQDLRWWKRAGVALAAVAILLAVAALLGQTPAVRPPVGASGAGTPEEIRAKRFVVLDAAGKERVTLGSGALAFSDPSAAAAFGLHLYGDDGTKRAELTDSPGLQAGVLGLNQQGRREGAFLSGSLLRLSGEEAEAFLSVFTGAYLALSGRGGALSSTGVSLSWTPSSRSASLDLTSGPQAQQFRLSVDPDLSGLGFSRGKAGLRAWLGLAPDASPRLALFDASGKVRAALGSTDLETIKTGAVTRLPESSLTLFDKDGKTLWQAP